MSEEHDDACERLRVAIDERALLESSWHRAVGTSSEFAAYARLRAGRREVIARQTLVNNIVGGVAINGRQVGGEGSIFAGSQD